MALANPGRSRLSGGPLDAGKSAGVRWETWFELNVTKLEG